MALGMATGLRRSALRQILRSVPWALGVGVGVALGGWLTVVGGSGAPGAGSLDLTQDILVVPGLSALAVLTVLTFVNVLGGRIRRRVVASRPGDDGHDQCTKSEDQQV